MKRNILVLAGGTGSVKLVRGLSKIPGLDLTVISNVGDNIWLHGLYVCPDIDTVMYGLASMLDTERGWGIKSDTFSWLESMKALGMPSWFALGDKDLATHVTRTELLQKGHTLTSVTDFMRRKLSIKASIIPATDDDVPTLIHTPDMTMHLQEFWVKYRGKPTVRSVEFKGVSDAKPSDNAIDAIESAHTIVVAPGNPVSSIGPIVAIRQLRSALQKRRADVIGVSPFVGSSPFSGPAAKYMRASGLDPSPPGVAKYYSDFAGTIAISSKDRSLAPQIKEMDVEPVLADIYMSNSAKEKQLALTLLRARGQVAT